MLQIKRDGLHDIDRENWMQFQKILMSYPEIYHRLSVLKSLNPKAYLAAGVIRNLIWSHLHQQSYSIESTEIDVVYFDTQDELGTEQQRLTQALSQHFPNNQWDVVNQAYVHRWYKTEQGQSISPFMSITEALASWPETATAIAVRFSNENTEGGLENEKLEIIAPFGLNDLMHLILRWNPALVSHNIFMLRLSSKQFLQRWPKLVLTQPNDFDDDGVETTMR